MTNAFASPLLGMLADSPALPTDKVGTATRLPKPLEIQSDRVVAAIFGTFQRFVPQASKPESFVLLLGNFLGALPSLSFLQAQFPLITFLDRSLNLLSLLHVELQILK